MIYIAVTEIAPLASAHGRYEIASLDRVHGRYEMASLLLSDGTDL